VPGANLLNVMSVPGVTGMKTILETYGSIHMSYFALCREAWDEMLTWASEKITHVCADQPHLRNDLPALVERLNDEARAPKKVSNHMSYIPVVPARGGAEVAVKIYIYKTFLIYRTCMRRAPAKPVRACIL